MGRPGPSVACWPGMRSERDVALVQLDRVYKYSND